MNPLLRGRTMDNETEKTELSKTSETVIFAAGVVAGAVVTYYGLRTAMNINWKKKSKKYEEQMANIVKEVKDKFPQKD
jgi:hypothetical protein